MAGKFTPNRNLLAIALVAVLAAAGVGYAAIPSADGTVKACYATTNALLLGIPHSKGDLRAIDTNEACRSYEKPVSWSQRGPQGDTGAQGPQGIQGVKGDKGDPGAPAPGSENSTVFIGGSSGVLPSAGSAEFTLPPSGTGTFGATFNNSNEQLVPVAMTARDLVVHIDAAPRSSASRTFILFLKGGEPTERLSCTIAGDEQTACNSGPQSFAIPAGGIVGLFSHNAVGPTETRAQWGWRAIGG